MNDNVYAQTQPIIRQIPDQQTQERILLDAQDQSQWHAIFSTIGEICGIQSLVASLKEYRYELKWYVFTL
jgi:hypothetical protein